MPILEVKNLKKKFGSLDVLKDISFSLEKGNCLAIIGASGSGKTTLLRCLNFLESPDSGSIYVKDKSIFDAAATTKNSEQDIRKKRLHSALFFNPLIFFHNIRLCKMLPWPVNFSRKNDPIFHPTKRPF